MNITEKISVKVRAVPCASKAALMSGIMVFGLHHADAQERSASAQALLEEIVVTARRRQESLDDIPLSIAAISADGLLAQGVTNIEDVGEIIPNTTLMQGDRMNHTRVVIRGIGGGTGDVTAAFGSGMYIDGHYIPSSLGGFMSTLDIERVEVLRGPQGTLFGKNVTGGAVNIISAKPGFEFDSAVTLRIAEFGTQEIRGMVNLPLSDTWAARFSAAAEQTDGYYYNRNLGTDIGAQDLKAFSAALRWQPENWTVDIGLTVSEQRDDNSPLQCNDMDGSSPQWGGGTGLIERIYPGATQDFKNACNADAAAGTFVNSSDLLTFSDIDDEALFVSAEWVSPGSVGMFDDLTVTMRASYRYFDYDYLHDSDGSYFAISAFGTSPVGSRPGTNRTRGTEILLEGAISERAELTLGVNTFNEEAFVGTTACRDLFLESGLDDPTNTAVIDCAGYTGTLIGLLPGPLTNPIDLPFLITQSAENDSVGVFGHLTYALNDVWDLDVGLRWTEDDRAIWNFEGPVEGCQISDDPAARSLGNTSLADTNLCDFTFLLSYVRFINDGFLNIQSGTFDAVTPMVSFSRHLDSSDLLDSGMIYFLYSEGFLTGGFNTEVNANLPAASSLRQYEPEDVRNYEVGFKGSMRDGAVRVAADIFFMDYSNKQDTIQIPNPDFLFGADDPLGVVQNVSSVDIYGIEFELRTTPWDGGFLSLDFGYLVNEYGEYTYDDPTGPGQIDLSSSVISDLTPEWTINLGLEHVFALSNGGTITPRLNLYAQDDYDFVTTIDSAPPSLCNQDAYTKVGVRVTYVPPAQNWQASLYGSNVTDEKIYEYCTRSRGVYIYRHERPAQWGFEFISRWGAGAS